MIREVTYQQLTREQRRNLHRRVAETTRAASTRRRFATSHFAALAHHWSHAEVPASTISTPIRPHRRRWRPAHSKRPIACSAPASSWPTDDRTCRSRPPTGFGGIARSPTPATAWASSNRAAPRRTRRSGSPACPRAHHVDRARRAGRLRVSAGMNVRRVLSARMADADAVADAGRRARVPPQRRGLLLQQRHAGDDLRQRQRGRVCVVCCRRRRFWPARRPSSAGS